jgi:hypothetical protein
MRAIARFVGLDLRSMRPNAKYMVIPVAIVSAPILLFFGPYLLVPAISGLAVASVPSYLFGNDERGRLDTLYTALGLRRRHVVAGRYATCLLLLVALTIAGVLLAPVAALAFDAAFDWAIAAVITVGSVVLIGILLAAQLPAYFATGPGRVRAVATIPPSIILAAVFVVWPLVDVNTVLQSRLSGADLAWLALAAIAVLGLVGAASTTLSARLYARRDL